MSEPEEKEKGVLERLEEKLEHMIGGEDTQTHRENYTHVPGHPRMGAPL